MKITYQVTATLNREQLFSILKESIEKKTNKKLANFHWDESDDGIYLYSSQKQ